MRYDIESNNFSYSIMKVNQRIITINIIGIIKAQKNYIGLDINRNDSNQHLC